MKVATVMRKKIKNYYAVVGDSYTPVDNSPHKQSWISSLANINGGLDGSEHSYEE